MMPAGAELDAAVAKAMGYHEVKVKGRGGRLWSDADGIYHQHRSYSTNQLHIPEMLAWLNERGWRVMLDQCTSCTPENRWHGEAWSPECVKVERNATTIQHALALLVVAVAARKEPKP